MAAKAERWLQAHYLTLPPPGPVVLPWLTQAMAGSHQTSAEGFDMEDDKHGKRPLGGHLRS